MAERVRIIHGDCMTVLPTLPADSVHAVVTDPPYHLTSIVKRFGNETARSNMESGDEQPPNRGAQYKRLSKGFMGKQWDGGDIAFRPDLWREVLRVLKPGGHVLAFGGTRTYHRLACAVEDAGFEIRDAIMWHYGSGFPKSHDVSKGIDRAAGHWRGRAGEPTREGESFGQEYERNDKGEPITPAAREWQGWGTALKPATEIIVLARKPLGKSTVAANVLAHGTGALNIDGCRVEADGESPAAARRAYAPPQREAGIWANDRRSPETYAAERAGERLGRWPANVLHDGSEEVLRAFPETGAGSGSPRHNGEFKSVAKGRDLPHTTFGIEDAGGSAARFFKSCPFSEGERRIFYSSKADAADRLQSKHPTVKPVSLLRYLCRLITPPGGTILDCFAGSGSLAFAAIAEGFNAILIERELEYVNDARRRIAHVSGQDAPLFAGAP